MKDEASYINMGFILYSLDKNSYMMSTRFYKLYSHRFDIPVDYIFKIINRIFPNDVLINILRFYLRNDISFRSIDDTNRNTLRYQQKIKIIPDAFGDLSIKSSDILLSELRHLKNGKRYYDIALLIFNKFKKLLINNETFEINDIFKIDDENVDFCYQHKIFSSNIAWGLLLNS